MQSVAVIYRPQIINVNSPVGFSCPRPKPKGKATTTDVEMLHVWVIPGLNFFNVSDQWEPLLTHASTKTSIENFIRRGVILVKKPEISEGAIATNTTSDYSDVQDVRDLIYHCNDAEWLRRCIAKDNRPSVDKWCFERIEEIEKIKKKNALPA